MECICIPVPGETALLTTAVYSGKTHDLDIWSIFVAGALGAVCGNFVAFWIGRVYGYKLLWRYGGYLHLNQARLKIGQYLFLRHSGKFVFLARFVPVLRSVAGLSPAQTIRALIASRSRMWPERLSGLGWIVLPPITSAESSRDLRHGLKSHSAAWSLWPFWSSRLLCGDTAESSSWMRSEPCRAPLSRPSATPAEKLFGKPPTAERMARRCQCRAKASQVRNRSAERNRYGISLSSGISGTGFGFGRDSR